MLQVLIIDRNEKNVLNIAKKITDIYVDPCIVSIADIDDAIEIINTECPDVVVVSLDTKDTKNRNLLDRLVKWKFEILIFQNDELYCLQNGKVAKKEGYVLKKI